MVDNQGDDIIIPTIMITRGWPVDDVETEDDCDDAFAYLTGAVVAIEALMDELSMRDEEKTHGYIRLKAALRWKKAALNIVNSKRSKINRAKSREIEAARAKRTDILDVIRRIAPDVWDLAMREVETK